MLRRHFPFLLALLLGGLWWYFTYRRLPPPGIVAPQDPVQEAVNSGTTWPLDGGRYSATKLASYHVRARVLGTKNYHDRLASIAPRDLVLGWGRMSDSAVYVPLDISQRGRFYVYQWGREGPPIPRTEIISHSANTHVIPADETVGRALSSVRIDDIITMDGALVEVDAEGGFRWRSSLTREDTGNGACELFRVTALVNEGH